MIKVSKEEYIKQAVTLGRDFLKNNDLDGFYQLMEEKRFANIAIGFVTTFLESKKIYLENYLTKVPAYACWCDNIPKHWLHLDRVDLPDKFIAIKHHAFGYCSDIKAISMKGVEAIGDYAFTVCPDLVSVEFGPKIDFIDQTAFLSCNSLTTFIAPDEATAEKLRGMCVYLSSPKGSEPADIEIWIDNGYYYDTVTIL